MQISAISAQGFTGKRDNIDAVIAQSDRVLRETAVEAALLNSNEKKHKRINNALWYSIPVAAGLAAAVLTKGKANLFTKEVSGTAAKLANGLKHGLGWGLAIGAADAVVGTNNFLRNNSDGVKKFEQKNPFWSFVGLIAAGMAVLTFLPKGLSKLYSKLSPKFVGKLAEKTAKVADKINSSKLVKSMNRGIEKLAKKVPSVAKEAGKTAVKYAPDALLIGTLAHSVGHSFAVNNAANQNYNTLKDAQLNLAKARVRELQVENDFLRTFPENEENLKLLKHPKAGLAEEIAQAMAEAEV